MVVLHFQRILILQVLHLQPALAGSDGFLSSLFATDEGGATSVFGHSNTCNSRFLKFEKQYHLSMSYRSYDFFYLEKLLNWLFSFVLRYKFKVFCPLI